MIQAADKPRPILDHQPGNMQATGGIIGDWMISFADGSSMVASQRQCFAEAQRKGFSDRDVQWTKAARLAWLSARKRRVK